MVLEKRSDQALVMRWLRCRRASVGGTALRREEEAEGRAGELVRKFVSRNPRVARDPGKIYFSVVKVQEELEYITDVQNYG